MTSFTSRTTATSARFALSGRVQTGAAALMLSVSALAMTSGTAQAQCVPAVGTAGFDVIVCDTAPTGVDALGDGDLIFLLDGVGTGTYTGNTGSDLILLDSVAATADYSAATIDGGADDDLILLEDTGGFGSSIGTVLGGTGNDTVTLDGASAGVISGGDGNDVIDLISGSVTIVNGNAGDDTITLDGATVGNIFGGTGADTIDLLSGTFTGTVFGGDDNDTITLDGATSPTTIFAEAGDDTIDLLSGTATQVSGGAGADIITLDGATVPGAGGGLSITGDTGNDTIDLLSGTAGGNVRGDEGADTITLNGASIGGDISGGDDNDTIALLSGTANGVIGGTGDDTITLDGASVTGSILGGDDNDTIDLLSGSAANASGNNGNDTITLNGASVVFDINGDAGDDVITLLSGSVGDTVFSGADNDTITLNGASVNGISGGSGEDTIDLLSGTSNVVEGSAGADTITLNGASISGTIAGGLGDDTIDLLSGTATDIIGASGNDTITLNGAAISGNLNGNVGDDTFFLTSGTFGGDLDGGVGSDTATIAPTFSLASIAGNLDGGDDTEFTTDGFTDILNIHASGTLAGEQILNWEIVNVINASLLLEGNTLVTAQLGDGGGVFLTNSTLDLDNGFAIFADEVVIDATSVLRADTFGGTGVFSVSDDLVNMNLIDMSDGFGAGDTLTIGDDYTSFSELHLDVALDSTEAGDSLVIADDIFGAPTEITFVDTNPSGSPSFTGTGPGNGIVVVDNSTGGHIVDTDFVFDPVAHPTNEILKVPFVYTLSLENDDILYLQSDVLAQIYGYAILSELMREDFPILRDRLGDIRYTGYDSDGNPEIGFDNASIWARVDGSKRDIEHDGGYNTGEWNASRGEAEIGIDIPMAVGGGVGVFGISAHAVRGYADANSGLTPNPDVAEVDTTGFGAGLSFAWFPGGGFYADVQGRITAWDADVENAARDIDQDINGLGWGVSLEVGNRFQIATNTAIIPRSQVVYTDVDFDSFTDDDGVSVSQDDSASIIVGPGVTLEQMFPDNGVAVFLDASVRHELLDESSIDASGFTFKSGLEDTWGTVSFGASLGVAEGASAYVAGDVSSPLTSTFGDSYGYGFRAGFRIDF